MGIEVVEFDGKLYEANVRENDFFSKIQDGIGDGNDNN